MGYTVSGFMGREMRRKIRENNVQRGTLLKADGTVGCDNNTYKKVVCTAHTAITGLWSTIL